MIRALVAVALLVLFPACSPPPPAIAGDAYFILQPNGTPDTSYSFFICNAQLNWYTFNANYPTKKFFAYYNPWSPFPDDNPIQNEFNAGVDQWLLKDGETKIQYEDDGLDTYIVVPDDVEYATYLSNWVETYTGHFDGIYFDQMVDSAYLPNWYVDSITTYTAYSSVEVDSMWGVMRDSLVTKTRRVIGADMPFIANCGVPPLISPLLSGITIEGGHVTTQPLIDEANAAFQTYVVPGATIWNVAWEWGPPHWASYGELSYTP